MRLFIAIDLNEHVRERISYVQGKLRSGDFDIKLVEPENLHLTLKFLGEVQENQRMEIEELVSETVKELHEFTLSFHGIGYFGDRKWMKVIWAGVDSGRDEFIRLVNSLDSRLSFIRKDEYEPTPHLTIARVKSGRNRQLLAHEVDSLRDVKIGEVNVNEVKLKQSLLTPQGPVYSDVKIFPLKRVD